MKVNSDKHKNGFTLIELVVVILILGILAAVAVPAYTGHIEKARAAADNYALGILNDVTHVYCTEEHSPNPFETSGTSDDILMQTLVDAALLSEKADPKQNGFTFTWDFYNKVWLLSGSRVLTTDDITFGSGSSWWESIITSSSLGTATSIVIPRTIGDVTISQIYQDAFSGKNLTSVIFASDSAIARIHARAFKDNNLTEIVFPDSIRNIDVWAFRGNDLTKITIGSNVIVEDSAFQDGNLFKDAYYAQGAGTYIFTGGQWVKQ